MPNEGLLGACLLLRVTVESVVNATDMYDDPGHNQHEVADDRAQEPSEARTNLPFVHLASAWNKQAQNRCGPRIPLVVSLRCGERSWLRIASEPWRLRRWMVQQFMAESALHGSSQNRFRAMGTFFRWFRIRLR
jgi:hypothetical protein